MKTGEDGRRWCLKNNLICERDEERWRALGSFMTIDLNRVLVSDENAQLPLGQPAPSAVGSKIIPCYLSAHDWF